MGYINGVFHRRKRPESFNTGFKDCNGFPIYERDLVKTPAGKKYIVTFYIHFLYSLMEVSSGIIEKLTPEIAGNLEILNLSVIGEKKVRN